KKNALTGQMDLFSMNKQESKNDNIYTFEILPEWPDKEKLEKERDVIGFYISSHPLETYKKQLAWFSIEQFETAVEKARTVKSEYTTICCGLLKTRKDIVTKKGDRMSFLQMEDMSGTAEIIAFPKTFARAEKWLGSHNVFIVKGVVDVVEGAPCKIKAQDIVPVELALSEWPHIEHITLTLPDSMTEETIVNIKERLPKGTAAFSLIFQENQKKLRLTVKERILLDTESAQLLEQHNIKVQCCL
ncbi:MAG TPA: OB-fold nucleic acid binding domain-containing protein, partial [Candidatus Babeliales bacterium]|nr:OB-fold nucleic acid binding domain-containing protein [Candidatus Babeliales bacterium]